MSVAGLKCPDCGSTNIVDDALYSQPQLVCVDCGAVVSEGALANDPVGVGGSVVLYCQTTAVSRKPCANLIKGQQGLKAMCRILRVHGEIEELSQTYYTQAYQHPTFINVSLLKKEALAGCCLLVSCRLRNWPVAMGTIVCLLDADPALVGGVYQEMVKVLDIQAPIVGITDVIEAHGQEYKVSSAHVPEELAENSKDLTKRAVALVELAADAWIVTGRRPIPVMMATIFLAWQSLKPTKQRLKFTLEKFCQLAKVNKHNPAMKRIAELKEVLCKLGREIPWLRNEVTPDNVLLQVGDILQFRYALLRRALRTHEADFEETPPSKTPGPEEPKSPIASTVGQCEVNADRSECGGGGGGGGGGGDGDESRPVSEKRSDSEDSPDLEPNWGKRVLFCPPCVSQAKRRRVQQPEGPDVNGDEEISDTEIDSYIRTPREVREFAETQKMLLESDQS